MVGAGGIVRARHLPALKKHPEVGIVAVSNLTYESSEKFCRENLPHATPMQIGPTFSPFLSWTSFGSARRLTCIRR